jgi:hypothetical protein
VGYSRILTETDDIKGLKHIDFSWIYTFRTGIGYNGSKIYIGASYLNTSVRCPTPVDRTRYIFNRGNIRFNFAYRIPFNEM